MKRARSKRFQSGREVFEFYVPSSRSSSDMGTKENAAEIGARAATEVLRRHAKDFEQIRKKYGSLNDRD